MRFFHHWKLCRRYWDS